MKHPFSPIILNESKKLIIGTLPPEKAPFYFSNSDKTRLWDILLAILENRKEVQKGGNNLDVCKKINILRNLSLGISDIILEYTRKKNDSTNDCDIIPERYNDILKLISNTEISTLLFVYESAAKWFMHSINCEKPMTLSQLKVSIDKTKNPFNCFNYRNREIRCILLPNPLNRGQPKGMTLGRKLEIYRSFINN